MNRSEREQPVRWSTDLISFYNTGYWGLGEHIPYGDWVDAVYAAPRTYFDTMLDGASQAALDGVELGPLPGGWEGALLAYGTARGFQDAINARGLVLSSSHGGGISVPPPEEDDPGAEVAAQLVAQHAAFAAELECDFIVMGTPPRLSFGPDAYVEVPGPVIGRVASELNRLGEIALRHGVRLAIHTDAYSVCSREDDIDRLMAQTDPDAVVLCLDSGHVTLDGADALEILRRHADRVPLMHWKDADGPLDGRTLEGDMLERHAVMLTHFREPGAGIVDWSAWFDVLGAAGWAGWAITENDMAADPIGEIRANLSFFRTWVAADGTLTTKVERSEGQRG